MILLLSDRHPRLGLALGAASAISFGAVTTFARLAYEGGSNTLTVVFLRAALAVIEGLLLARLFGQSLRIHRGALVPVLCVGLGLAMISLGYLGSVAYIPVGLAALIFYTFPLMVLAVTAAAEQRLPTGRDGVAFALAFFGLALALGPSFATLDGRGIMLALLAAIGSTLLFVAGARVTRDVGSMTVTAYANAVVAVVVGVPVLLGGDFHLPQGHTGWTALIAVAACYLVGIAAQFPALRHAGPRATALIFNCEPLVAIVAGALFLGETLSPAQSIGAAMVIAALFAATGTRSGG